MCFEVWLRISQMRMVIMVKILDWLDFSDRTDRILGIVQE